MLCTVLDLYDKDYVRFLMNAQCLWIMQFEGETWAHRVKDLISDNPLKLEVEVMLNSMKFSMGDTSTEPTMSQQKISGIPVVGEWTESIPTEIVPLT